jgi:hypothetical protein
MELMVFQKTKCSCFILPQNSMFYNEQCPHFFPFSYIYPSKKNSPMIYSNSNGDKNHVI